LWGGAWEGARRATISALPTQLRRPRPYGLTMILPQNLLM